MDVIVYQESHAVTIDVERGELSTEQVATVASSIARATSTGPVLDAPYYFTILVHHNY